MARNKASNDATGAAPKAPRAGGTGLPAKPGSAAAAGGQAFHTAVAEAKEELRQELLTLAKEFNGGETIKASLQQHRERMDAARINLKKMRAAAKQALAESATKAANAEKTWVSTVKDAAAKADAAMADVTAKEKAANDDAANAAKAVLEKFKAEINKIMLGGGGGSSAGGGKGRAT